MVSSWSSSRWRTDDVRYREPFAVVPGAFVVGSPQVVAGRGHGAPERAVDAARASRHAGSRRARPRTAGPPPGKSPAWAKKSAPPSYEHAGRAGIEVELSLTLTQLSHRDAVGGLRRQQSGHDRRSGHQPADHQDAHRRGAFMGRPRPTDRFLDRRWTNNASHPTASARRPRFTDPVRSTTPVSCRCTSTTSWCSSRHQIARVRPSKPSPVSTRRSGAASGSCSRISSDLWAGEIDAALQGERSRRWSGTWSNEAWSETGAAIVPAMRRTDLNGRQLHRFTCRNRRNCRSTKLSRLPWGSRGRRFKSCRPDGRTGGVLFAGMPPDRVFTSANAG